MSSIRRLRCALYFWTMMFVWRYTSVQRHTTAGAFSLLPKTLRRSSVATAVRQKHIASNVNSLLQTCGICGKRNFVGIQQMSTSDESYVATDDTLLEEVSVYHQPVHNDNLERSLEYNSDRLRYWTKEQGLNEAQCEAVMQPLSAISRVVAGPGSGKTRALTCRIAQILNEAPGDRVLAVTFTRKAAGEMQRRLEILLAEQRQQQQQQQQQNEDESSYDAILQQSLRRVTLGTFHSVCSKILRWNGDLLSTLPSVERGMSDVFNATSLDGNFVIIDQGEQLRLLKECLTEANINLNDFMDIRPFYVLSAISTAKSTYAVGNDPFLPPKNGRPLPPLARITSKVYPIYVRKMLSTNCLDFDDLILFARELLMSNKDVREALQRRWTHVLVDEFQDTSKTQMDLVKLLTSTSLFVVGDADQSIYSWRGAHVGSLMDLEHDFKDYLGGVQTVYLMENYRSTSNIVKAAQKIISSSSGSKSAKLRQDMKPKRGSGPSPRVIACKDDREEATYVVKSIKEKVDDGTYSNKHEVALIFRTNAQGRVLEDACVKYNLPYVVFGASTSFYKRQEIKDTLCYLRWLYNGMDRGSMLRVFKTPAKGLGEKALTEFDEYCGRVEEFMARTNPASPRPTPLDVLLSFSAAERSPGCPAASDCISTRPLKLFTEFSGRMRALRDKAYEEPLENILSYVVNEFELLPYLDKISKTKGEFEERKANVEELQKATQRYNADGPCLIGHNHVPTSRYDDNDTDSEMESPLGSYLDDVALVTDMADQARESDDQKFKVCLMTVHASKGMEFDTVFVVGNEDGTFPTSQALNEGEGSVALEEERRLCYVAMTRAKTELFLTWRKEVPIFTAQGIRTVDKKRSRFLEVLVGKKGKPQAPEEAKASLSTTTKKSAPSREGTNAVLGKRSISPRSNGSQSVPRRTASTATPAHRQNPRTNYARSEYPNGQAKSWNHQERNVGRSSTTRPEPFATRRRPVPSDRQSRTTGTNSLYKRQQPPTDFSSQETSWRPSPKPEEHIRPSAPKKQAPKNENMDSTWFFPVGSKVKHERFGEGVVLSPPPPAKEGDMPVLVKFPDGERREFSARGTDLSPVLF